MEVPSEGVARMREPAAPDQGSLLWLLVQTGRHAENAAEAALAEHGLRYDLWAVIGLLRARGTCAMAEIADEVVLPPPSVTRVVDKLIADGLVHRLSDPADRRRVLARLTRRGEQLHDLVLPAVRSATDSLMSSVEQSQRDRLVQALRAVSGAEVEVG